MPWIFPRLRFPWLFVFLQVISVLCLNSCLQTVFQVTRRLYWMISLFGHHDNIWGRNCYYSSFTWEETEAQRWSNFLIKVTQLARSRAGLLAKLTPSPESLLSPVPDLHPLLTSGNLLKKYVMYRKGFLVSPPEGLKDRGRFSLLSTSTEPHKGRAAECASMGPLRLRDSVLQLTYTHCQKQRWRPTISSLNLSGEGRRGEESGKEWNLRMGTSPSILQGNTRDHLWWPQTHSGFGRLQREARGAWGREAPAWIKSQQEQKGGRRVSSESAGEPTRSRSSTGS